MESSGVIQLDIDSLPSDSLSLHSLIHTMEWIFPSYTLLTTFLNLFEPLTCYIRISIIGLLDGPLGLTCMDLYYYTYGHI